ncbi:DUF3613 domain-containing protein [Quatrionicoccus australiensis]|uniref:DUF3613 domain-containing protein n=1 Tax=Quatrionicoccus australiensis TaxID=138118 RepID=UPI001CFA5F34|nr:DUF3613 domain-containing protein [Quatrionicoccus australiensis]MCB4360490.1 DUF3613 domain-containing protein [Quatrionicoccus australiensis]
MKPESTILAGLCIAAGVAFSGALSADEGKEKVQEIGAATSALLELQRSGAAAGKAQPVSGDVASRSYQRYLEGFSQPQPESKDSASSSNKPSAPRSR